MLRVKPCGFGRLSSSTAAAARIALLRRDTRTTTTTYTTIATNNTRIHTRILTTPNIHAYTPVLISHIVPSSPSSSSSVSVAKFHSTARVSHGRHHHEHEVDEDEEEWDDDDDSSPATKPKYTAPVTPEDKSRMESECTSITMRGVYWNITLAVFKFLGGIFGNSMAMLADAVHSLSDLVTDGITLWAARLTHKPQDADHPYGHGKFEAIGSLTISGTLALTAAGIGWSAIESIQTILNGQELAVPTGIALVAAVASIGIKEILYHQTLQVGQRWNSKVIKANAWHHRSDSVSTLVAMFGVVGGMIQIPILDPIAGLFVSGLILKAAVELGWDSLRDLTDESIDEELQSNVSEILHSMREEGVLSFHRLRGRAMGPFVLMDVHISVSPLISVSAAHQIAERARIRVRQQLPVVAELLVHVDVASTDALAHSLFDDHQQHNHDDDDHEVTILTDEHINEIVEEYQASRMAMLAGGGTSTAAAAASSSSSSAPSQSTKLIQSLATFMDHAAPSTPKEQPSSSSSSSRTSTPLDSKRQPSSIASSSASSPSSSSSSGAASSSATAAASSTSSQSSSSSTPAPLDLARLMRPQPAVERDVRRVLSDPHASYTQHLKGVSHFTCHFNPTTQQLRVQLELAFHSDQLTIKQASAIAKSIESSILAQVKDVHSVDTHLELTEQHIRQVKHVEPPRELTP